MNTSDATATAEDIISGKTAYVNGQKIFGSLIPEIIPNSIFTNKILKFSSDITSVEIPHGESKNLSQYDILFAAVSYGTKYGSDMIFLLYDLSVGCGISCVYGSNNQTTEISGDSITMIIDRHDIKLASISEKVGKSLYMYTDFHSGDDDIFIRLSFDNKIVYNKDTSVWGVDTFYVLSYSS